MFTTESESDINQRMELFGKYLDRTGMEHKEYQFEGVRWCLKNELRDCPVGGVRGGFIADEMGLGKTIMMIGLMLCNFLTRTLIVLPPILIDQWVLQIYRTTGHRALVYHGANKKKITLDMMKRAIIVITSYGDVAYVRGGGDKDKKKEKSLLFQVRWSRVVYDEAHHMRNAKTVLFERVKKLKAGICWLVSGTPIQNRLKDFHNLCSLLGLGKKSVDLSLMGDFVLKRTKQEVGIPMPLLSVDKIMVGWKNQKELELSESIHRFIPHAIREEKLMAMMFAKQSCIMSGLLEKNLWLLSELGVLENMNDVNLKEGVRCSSKLDKVVEKIIERKGNGCGKIVFCHFHKEMDEIGRRLCFDGGMAVAMFDGRVGGVKKRQSILNSGVEVLLLQIQTGCEGLNLQENYSEIYFVSPHWNPAVEEQAIARCHRIGQMKPVVVERFVMGDFIEEEKEKADLEKEPNIMLTMDNYISKVQDEKKKFHI